MCGWMRKRTGRGWEAQVEKGRSPKEWRLLKKMELVRRRLKTCTLNDSRQWEEGQHIQNCVVSVEWPTIMD